jgi:hypothetical protein
MIWKIDGKDTARKFFYGTELRVAVILYKTVDNIDWNE